MASFDAHISQAKKNLQFLKHACMQNGFCDWHVTVAYYSAVHLINAHLDKSVSQHPTDHVVTKSLIDPNGPLKNSRIPIPEFTAYTQLEGISRRARYLINENNPKKDPQLSHKTKLKDFFTALGYLEMIMDFIRSKYGSVFDKVEIELNEEAPKSLPSFKYFDLKFLIVSKVKAEKE